VVEKVSDLREFERTVGGSRIKVEIDLDDLKPGDSVEDDAGHVAQLMGTVAELIAEYQTRHDHLDAIYRGWRAAKANTIRARDPKLAEHKVKAETEGCKQFVEYIDARDGVGAQLDFLRNIMSALRVKAQMIRVRADLALYAHEGAGLTSEPGKTPPRRRGRAKRNRDVGAAMRRD
jgi:hypothetical protein